MTYQEKNITASLVTFTLILGYYLISLLQMTQGGSLTSGSVFRLWGIVIVLGIIVTIATTILAHIISAIIQAIKSGGEEPEIDDTEDERDKLIDLKGTKVAYIIFSSGGFLSMLTFTFGQPPLILFTLLIFSGIVAQIIGDISRLYLYRRGF